MFDHSNRRSSIAAVMVGDGGASPMSLQKNNFGYYSYVAQLRARPYFKYGRPYFHPVTKLLKPRFNLKKFDGEHRILYEGVRIIARNSIVL